MKFREYLNEETLKVGDWKEDCIEKKGSCRKSIVKFDDWYVPNYTFS